jgi:hypothetical protein
MDTIYAAALGFFFVTLGLLFAALVINARRDFERQRDYERDRQRVMRFERTVLRKIQARRMPHDVDRLN